MPPPGSFLNRLYTRLTSSLILLLKREAKAAADGQHLWFAIGFHMQLLALGAKETFRVPIAILAFKLGPEKWTALVELATMVGIEGDRLKVSPKMSGS